VKNQEPDQRAVDADTSQILADLQLKAIDKDGGVPIVDHRGDIGTDFRPAGQHRAQRQQPEPPVDPRPARGLIFQPPAGRAANATTRWMIASQWRGRSSLSAVSSSSHDARVCSANTGLARKSCFKASPCARISGPCARSSINFSTKALACSRHGWFLRHVLYDRRFMARERRLNEIEALIEQRLPCFLRPQDRESVGGERRRGHRLDPALRGKSHPFVDRFFRREVERVRNGVSGGGRDRLRVALVLEPSRRKTDKVDRRTPRDGDARERKLLVMKRPIAGPIRRLFSGTTSVW
jgi:hypothetical protein